MIYKANKYFGLVLENPFKTWWKARKYFKIPKTKISFFYKKHSEFIPAPYVCVDRISKIIDINIHDIIWKDKWDSPRHEINPYIFVCLFRKFGFIIQPKIYWYNEFGEKNEEDSSYLDIVYWEYLLDYLYYSKNLKLDSWWTSDSKIFTIVKKWGNKEDGTEDEIIPLKIATPVHLISLNKKGLKVFKKLYDKK